MERLTNSIDYCQLHCDFGKSNECLFQDKSKCYEKNIYEKLREYEDLEEQGLMLRLPCKVGDTVYRIENGKITQTKITKYDMYADSSIWFSFSTSLSLPMSKFKTCIFFTRAEAEQKLKEMEDNKDLER